jgi:predicted amidophosphoribosyltransferase
MPIALLKTCPICNETGAYNITSCENCKEELEKALASFPLVQTLYGDQVLFAFRYVDFSRKMMLSFKYGKCFHLSRLFAEALWGAIKNHIPLQGGAIVPVPSSWIKMYRRKHNPTELIAREFNTCSGIPLHTQLLRKRMQFNDISQAGLNRMERFANPSVEFVTCRHTLTRPHPAFLLVLDDVSTTGATLHACKKALNLTFPDIPVILVAVAHG